MNVSSSRMRLAAGCLVALIAAIALTSAVRQATTRADMKASVEALTRPSPPVAKHGSPAPAGQSQAGLVREIRVFVHREDLYPDVVTVRPGRVRIVAENETGSDVALTVDRVRPGLSSVRTARVATTDRSKRNREELVLEEGEYIFYEESRPQLQGKIIVDLRPR